MVYMRPLHPGEQIWKEVMASSSLMEVPEEEEEAEEELQEVSLETLFCALP